jgi:hypothetical protein
MSGYARYLIYSLPLLLILMAEGIDWLARHVWVRGATIVAWTLTALIVACWDAVHPVAVSRTEKLALCPGGQVSA